MYFQVTGTAKFKGLLVGKNGEVSYTTSFNYITKAKTIEKAQEEAISMMAGDHAIQNDYIPVAHEWESTPDVTIVPPDKVNRLLGLEVAQHCQG